MTPVQLLFLKCLAVYLLCINLIAAIAAVSDKRRAKRNAWRIPEARLLLFGAIGGALGEWIAMLLIRHKTKHLKFMLLLPLFLTAHVVLLGWLIISFLH